MSGKPGSGRKPYIGALTCHPDRKHFAKGLCQPCYGKQRYDSRREEFTAAKRAYHKNNKHKWREWYLKRQYGITSADYEKMEREQDFKCAACRTEKPLGGYLDIDHDHKTGKIRSLLCEGCNGALGLVKDSAQTLAALIEYLKKHNAQTV